MEFIDLLSARHSAVNFVEDFEMSEQDFKQIFELTKSAPSAYNLQSTHYFVITDKTKKERIRALNYNQYKIHSASGVILVLGDATSTNAKNAEKIYRPLTMLKMMDELEYETTMQMIANFHATLEQNPTVMQMELMRNAGLHAMQFMLSAKALGFDTCPMHLHNFDEIRQEFNIPPHLHPIMMITIGKSVDKVRPRGYRKPVGEFVTFNKFD
jgi:putative NAD(P)H nitroreductase